MPLVPLRDLLDRSAPTAAFNVIQIEHAEAIAAAADETGAPVVLQISENAVRYHGSLAPISRAALAIAASAVSPVAVHLDHATSEDLIREAVDLGFGSVMFDGSALGHDENVARTAAVVRRCHGRDVSVEAELGEIGGKNGVHEPGARTDPDEAARYVEATGVDALAVAVGSSHAMLTRTATLDFDLIARLKAAVPVPLVLHGSSGVADEHLAAAVRAGMRKINIATQLNKFFTAAIRAGLGDDPVLVDPRRYLGAGREAMTTEVARLIRVLEGR
ncbi:class II fructose-bisphosphate aldolase [Umezawaea tangerina]|uniref:Fructose-bisphosphate aldolase class II n=1 Tax=Umezawaea tangerina TaxID=84725 RepID=A0A2T0SYZ5_9PSEU|nr:class II fructose-bisphosphate aldolase [Umezawaea tangerina]PRY38635.1 fructose-bisphosphate aldolase class II [Umezawaea tangerina]